VGGDQLGEEGESEEEGSIRMIDLPFSLFDDD